MGARPGLERQGTITGSVNMLSDSLRQLNASKIRHVRHTRAMIWRE